MREREEMDEREEWYIQLDGITGKCAQGNEDSFLVFSARLKNDNVY